ncbi:MAG: DUF3783 domain-containing protein [Candidatus Choladocola sp.]|nr:DUF3783 domain-containing protein [Candidatus Choladocola sp.]
MSTENKKMGKTLLFHTDDTKKDQQTAQLCRQLGVEVRKLKQEDLGRRVGDLAGIVMKVGKNSPEDAQEVIPVGYNLPEVMIFSGFTDEALDEFLAGYRHAGIAPVGLKAVVTPYNCQWTVYSLVRELIRERMAFLTNRK